MPKDVSDQKLTIQSPKSGKHAEVVFIPRTVVERLRAYIKERAVEAESRIFPITYSAARIVVKKAGRLAGIELRPHDLRRRAATDASRSGVPIETISKVSLRHSNLATTQRYLGEISETEAASWIENLYGIKKAFRVPPPQSKHTVPWFTWIERLRGLVADMEL